MYGTLPMFPPFSNILESSKYCWDKFGNKLVKTLEIMHTLIQLHTRFISREYLVKVTGQISEATE